MKNQGTTRRSFLTSSAMAGFFISASSIYGQAVKAGDDKLRILKVGSGGMGNADFNSLTGNGGIITGVCDVNPRELEGKAKKFPGIPTFSDYRKMLSKINPSSYDAVCVSTADHTHATIALAAMRLKKHVYVQKPLAHSYEECEMLIAAAKKYGVVTQMGNQGHPGVYRYERLLQNNFWGDILAVHSWTDRAKGWWPQGMTGPAKEEKMPDGYNWDAWLGPAQMRPYSSAYTPFKWRGWCDFGCGAIGDMAVHNFDPAFWVLQLDLPLSVKAWVDSPAKFGFPLISTIDFNFGPTPVCPNGVNVYWYESKLLPKPPAGAHQKLDVGGNGLIIEGSKATTLGGSHANKPRCIALPGKPFGPETKEMEKHGNDLLKDPGKWQYNHYREWVDACKAGDTKKCGSRFEYAAKLTEALLFGCIAQHFPNETLYWDNAKQEFNKPEATAMLKGSKRKGFEPFV